MRNAFCAEVSQEAAEPLAATASRIDHWLLVEYRGLWGREPLESSVLSDEVKTHLGRQLAELPRSRLAFIRRPHRRGHPELHCYFGTTLESAQPFYELEVEDHRDLLELDFAAALLARATTPARPLRHPLLLVCTHGKRDRCCARFGRPLYDDVREQVEDDWVWQATHVGGDRFAGNLVCLPEGLYFGRVGRGDVWPLLDDYLAGRIHLDRFRGRCCYPFPVQAAERSVRLESGLTGIDDLALLSVRRTDANAWEVRFEARPSGDVHELDVAVELGELTYLTCNSETLKRPRRFVTTGQRVRRDS